MSYIDVGTNCKYMTAEYGLCQKNMENSYNNYRKDNDTGNHTCLKAFCLNKTSCSKYGKSVWKTIYGAAAGNNISKSAESLHQGQSTNHRYQMSVCNQPSDEKTNSSTANKANSYLNQDNNRSAGNAKGKYCLCCKNTGNSHCGTNTDINTAKNDYISKTRSKNCVQTHLSEQVNNVRRL